MSEFHDEYGKALDRKRYSAGTAQPHEMLSLLGERDRWPSERPSNNRAVVADYLADADRPEEEALLRDPKRHVVVHEGKVVPGRFTVRHIHDVVDRVDDLLPHPNGARVTFVATRPEDEGYRNIVEGDGYAENSVSPDRHVWHHSGWPMVEMTDDTCGQWEHPLPEVRKEAHDSLTHYIRTNVEHEGLDPRVGAEAHRIADTVLHAPVEEPAA